MVSAESKVSQVMFSVAHIGMVNNDNKKRVSREISMDNKTIKDYADLLDSLKDRYCRLLLITGDPTHEKDTLIKIFGSSSLHLQLGKTLVGMVSNLSFSQRSNVVLDFFANLQSQSETLLLLDIEILFDRSLGIDPLMLLKNTARNRSMIVNWPGKIDFDASLLTYATPGHSEYFEADMTDDILFWDESGRNSLNYKITGGCYEV